MIKKPLFGTRELCDFAVSGSARSIARSKEPSAFEVSSRVSELGGNGRSALGNFIGDREKSFDFPRRAMTTWMRRRRVDTVDECRVS